jgi:hypothetical protein
MPDISPTVIEPVLAQQLGQIVTRWSSLEDLLSHLIATLVNGDPAPVSILTGTAGCATQIQWIQTLISIHEHKDPELSKIGALVKRAEEMRTDRNALIHGLWNPVGCESGTCLVATFNWKHSEIIKEWLITTTELEELLDDINVWIGDYIELGKKMGFPRRRGKTKSIFLDDD